MAMKMTRGEKISKEFQELYNKLLAQGLRPPIALSEARKVLKIENRF